MGDVEVLLPITRITCLHTYTTYFYRQKEWLTYYVSVLTWIFPVYHLDLPLISHLLQNVKHCQAFNWKYWYYHRPQRSCGQGNIFTPVCHSFCSRGVYLVWSRGVYLVWSPGGGGVCQVHPPGPGTPRDQVPAPDQVHPLRTRYTTPLRTRCTPPQDQVHPPDQVHPLGPGTAPQYTPPGPGTPPWPGTPRDQVHPPRNTANERPVRILLECILVSCENRHQNKLSVLQQQDTVIPKLYISMR